MQECSPRDFPRQFHVQLEGLPLFLFLIEIAARLTSILYADTFELLPALMPCPRSPEPYVPQLRRLHKISLKVCFTLPSFLLLPPPLPRHRPNQPNGMLISIARDILPYNIRIFALPRIPEGLLARPLHLPLHTEACGAIQLADGPPFQAPGFPLLLGEGDVGVDVEVEVEGGLCGGGVEDGYGAGHDGRVGGVEAAIEGWSMCGVDNEDVWYGFDQ